MIEEQLKYRQCPKCLRCDTSWVRSGPHYDGLRRCHHGCGFYDPDEQKKVEDE